LWSKAAVLTILFEVLFGLRFFAFYVCITNQWNTRFTIDLAPVSPENSSIKPQSGFLQQTKLKGMKMTNTQPMVNIEKEALHELCKEVKETLANQADIKTTTQPFGVADLWKIHRSTKYRVQRRNLMM